MATDEEKDEGKREELLDKIHDASDDLQDAMDDLMSSLDYVIKEAEDEETDIETLEDIYEAIISTADKQEREIEA